MNNLAYNGFCPRCHNYWIFCDCVDSFGTIGEDLAKDEGQEDDGDDEPEVDVSFDPQVTVGDPILGSPDGPFSPGFTGTPGDPSVLSPTNPDDPVSLPGHDYWGAKGESLIPKTPYEDQIMDDAVSKDKKKIHDMFTDVSDAIALPHGKKRKPNSDEVPMPDADKLPGQRLPFDDTMQHQVPPNDFDASDLDPILPMDLSTMLDAAAGPPKRSDQYDIQSLSNKYQLNGEPEVVRRGPRPDALRNAGIPVFDGAMFSKYPPSMTNQEKKDVSNFSQEYIDFLENELRPWVDSLDPITAGHFASDCYVSDYRDRVPDGDSQQGVYQVGLKKRGDHNTYTVTPNDGSPSFVIRTTMDLSKDFFKSVDYFDMQSMLLPMNQDGVQQFKVEYSNGSPRVVIGQSQMGRNHKTTVFTSGIRRINTYSYGATYFDGTFDVVNDPPLTYTPMSAPPPPPPVYYYRKNTNLNTRRLTGDGSLSNAFKAVYEKYNAATFMTCTHGYETDTAASSSRTSQDNWGDPNFVHEIYNVNSAKSQVFKYIFEMINESNDPFYTEATHAIFSLKNIALATGGSGFYNIWIDKSDGSRYYPAILGSGNSDISTNVVLRTEGSTNQLPINFGVSGAATYMYAHIKCNPNDGYLNSFVTENEYCCINVEYTGTLRIAVDEVCQLVKTNTVNRTFQPIPPVEVFSPGELVGAGKFIPSSFQSEDGTPMSAVSYTNLWTKCLVWRRTSNAVNIVKYLVNEADVQTNVFPTYAISVGSNRQFYMFSIYCNDNGREDFTSSPYCVFNANSIYPISGGANTNILFRLAMTITFDNFIF